jgi:hypothetical protein
MVLLFTLPKRVLISVWILLLAIVVLLVLEHLQQQQQISALFHESLFKSNNHTGTTLSNITTTTEKNEVNRTTNLPVGSQLTDSEKKMVVADKQLGILSLGIEVAQNPIAAGSRQTITVTASEQNSNVKVIGAEVVGNIKYVTTTTKEFSGITDSTGKVSYSWKIGANSKPGTFTIEAKASANGYEHSTRTRTFEVVKSGP